MQDKPYMTCPICRKETLELKTTIDIQQNLLADGTARLYDSNHETVLSCPKCGVIPVAIYEYDAFCPIEEGDGKLKWKLLKDEYKEELLQLLNTIDSNYPFNSGGAVFNTLAFLGVDVADGTDSITLFPDFGLFPRPGVSVPIENGVYYWSSIVRALAIIFTGTIPDPFVNQQRETFVDSIDVLSKEERAHIYKQSRDLLTALCNEH